MNQKLTASSPNLPWKVKLHTSLLCFLVDASRSSNGRVNRRIMNLVDFKSSPSSKNPINGVKTSDVIVDATRNLSFRLYIPTTATTTTSALPVIVYFHGGGFVFMTADSKIYDDFCCRLARELPAVIISVNYRLAPEHRIPCQYEDGFDVLKFIDKEASDVLPDNANLKQCFIAGDSAGGNLAHNVTLKASEYNNNISRIKLKGLIAIQPFFGGEERTKSETELVGAVFTTTERTDWMWRAVLPDGADRDHEAVNVFGPNSVDISGIGNFPETIVFVGGFDMLQDWQRMYYEGLKKSGKEARLIEYPNAIHGFYIFPELPESVLMIKEVRDFIYRSTS